MINKKNSNKKPHTVRIEDRKVTATAQKRAQADPSNLNHVGAPMPGVISSVVVVVGQHVKEGDLLMSIEAMKMETGISADKEGVIKAIHAPAGTQVDAKDLLIEFEA